LANRFGRKPALRAGIYLQIISSFICILAGILHKYPLLIAGRFLLALGSAAGLKITFTLVNECFDQKTASQKLPHLMLAFAITPGLSVAIGGILNAHYGWMSCFYAGAFYGLALLPLTVRLPETQKILDRAAFKVDHLITGYSAQFKNSRLLTGALLMGGGTCFVYIFAALAPFIAINLLGMSSAQYGSANILPAVGLALGSLFSAQLAKKYPLDLIIQAGFLLAGCGALLMLLTMMLHVYVVFFIFLSAMLVYFGSALIFANASIIAMQGVSDKAHGSAVMSFVSVGCATAAVLSLSFFAPHILLLPIAYLIICGMMLAAQRLIKQ
jgi:MFS family permease